MSEGQPAACFGCWPRSAYPTDPFTIIEPQNPSIDISENIKCVYLWVLRLLNPERVGRSGCSVRRSSGRYVAIELLVPAAGCIAITYKTEELRDAWLHGDSIFPRATSRVIETKIGNETQSNTMPCLQIQDIQCCISVIFFVCSM